MIKYTSLILCGISIIFGSQEIQFAHKIRTKDVEILQQILPVRDLPAIVLGYLYGWDDENIKVEKMYANDIKFSPNGKYFGIAGGKYSFFSVHNNTFTPIKSNLNIDVHNFGFSPCDTYVATRFFNPDNKPYSSIFQVINLQDNSIALRGEGHTDCITDIQFSPNGQYIASASWDKKVKIWKKKENSFQFLQDLIGHANTVTRIDFSADSQHIASASCDNTVKIWLSDGEKYSVKQTLRDHNNWVSRIKFLPKEKVFISFSHDKTVKVWKFDGNHYSCIQTLFGHLKPDQLINGSLDDFIFSSDGTKIFIFTVRGKSILWVLRNKVYEPVNIFDGPCLCAAFSHDNTYLAIGMAEGKITEATSDKIQIWKKEAKSENYRLYQDLKLNSEHVTKLVFSLDNLYLISGSDVSFVNFWKNQAIELEKSTITK